MKTVLAPAVAALVALAGCSKTPEQRCRKAPADPTLTEANISQRMMTMASQTQTKNGVADLMQLLEPMGMSYCSLATNLEATDPADAAMYRSMGTEILKIAEKQEPDSDLFSVMQKWVKP